MGFLGAAILLLALILLPLAALVASVTPGQALAAFARPDAIRALHVSLAASAAATAIAALLGIPAGYALANLRAPLATPWLFALALPPAFPPVASGIMLLALLGPHSPLGAALLARGWIIPDSFLGVVAAEFFVSASFVALASFAAFGSLDPSYADAARTLRVSETRIFLRIALPMAWGGVAAGIAFAWLRAIGEYGATSIVAYHPTSLPIALYVALAARGVVPALALGYGFVGMATVVLVLQYAMRHRMV